ncbi:MAG TPA: cytochrome c3 family protein [Candidatus Methylomirabilis sp.]|nr:cytochrome c3 family protein [Candidatus Methylomirabilis sp.]
MQKKWLTLAFLVLGILGLPPFSGLTGEYHVSGTLICFDCHTMHFSETQGYSPTDPYGTGSPMPFPLTGSEPHPYLLRTPQNNICLSCHNGSTASAPDVHGVTSVPPEDGREAGAIPTGAAPYENWKGHTLGSTDPPPGYDPSLVGLPDWYSGTSVGLKCIHCHQFHGSGAPYRNLGPEALGGSANNFRPSYAISTTNDQTKDVWINIASQSGTPGSRTPGQFNPYYSAKNIRFNRIEATVGSLKTSNKMGSFCAACHAGIHGGPGNANIGASPGVLNNFLRHPTSQVTIGSSTFGGHSSLDLFQGKANKVKVFATDFSAYSDATPGCISCHKAHGNQNAFGLIYMGGTGTIGEEGTMTGDVKAGALALCGQCHDQAS